MSLSKLHRVKICLKARGNLPDLAALFLAAILAVQLLIHATVMVEAFIPFRVIDNFWHGYGLCWNIDERVQVFTSPLWLLLQGIFHPLGGNDYLINIILSALCVTAALYLLIRALPGSFWLSLMLVVLPLLLSHTFTSYAISGLETPLSFLMFAGFIAEYMKDAQKRDISRAVLWASLCVLTRYSNILLILPALTALIYIERWQLPSRRLFLASMPLLAWLGFSLLYFGFFLPNPAYAKWPSNVGFFALVAHGFKYFYTLSYYDSPGFVVILVAVGMFAKRFYQHHFKLQRMLADPLALLGAGVLLDLCYEIITGGDYTLGWSFANVIFVSVAIIAFYCSWVNLRLARLGSAGLVMLYLVQYAFIAPNMPSLLQFTRHYGANDQPAMYYAELGLLPELRQHLRSGVDNELEKYPPVLQQGMIISSNIALFGYFADPSTIIVDMMGNTEPMLARLPALRPNIIRAGSYERALPEGYALLRKYGDISRVEFNLASYYERLRLVTSGRLFDPERLKAILAFQFGLYDDMLKDAAGKATGQ